MNLTTRLQKNKTSSSGFEYRNYELSKTLRWVFEYAQKLKKAPGFNTKVFDILELKPTKNNGI